MPERVFAVELIRGKRVKRKIGIARIQRARPVPRVRTRGVLLVGEVVTRREWTYAC